MPGQNVSYLAMHRIVQRVTGRAHRNISSSACKNPNITYTTGPFDFRGGQGGFNLLLLNDQFALLGLVWIDGQRCSNPAHFADARLLVGPNDRVFLSYVHFALNHCKGHWVDEIKFSISEQLPGKVVRGYLVGMGQRKRDLGGMFKLAAPRNSGIVQDPVTGEFDYELVDVMPFQLRRLQADLLNSSHQQKENRSHFEPERSVPNFARGMHNSMHPLYVAEFGGYIGVGHRHYTSGAHPIFKWGHSYRHVVFLMRRQPNGLLMMSNFSRELCFPALRKANTCEAIQFVMSAFRLGSGVAITYGVNDCESAFVSFSINKLSELLSFEVFSDSLSVAAAPEPVEALSPRPLPHVHVRKQP